MGAVHGAPSRVPSWIAAPAAWPIGMGSSRAHPRRHTNRQRRRPGAHRRRQGANTTRAYRSGWAAWQRWAVEHGHQTMPAAPAAGAAYLTHRASVVTVRMARAAISARHRQGADDEPCKHPGVVQVLKGLSRNGRGRCQVQGLDWRAADLAAGIAANGGHSPASRRAGVAGVIPSIRAGPH